MSRCNFYVEKLRHKNKIQSQLRSCAQKPRNYVTNCHYELFSGSNVRIRAAMNEQQCPPPWTVTNLRMFLAHYRSKCVTGV